MVKYKYKCNYCGKEMDLNLNINDRNKFIDTQCTYCGKGILKRKLSINEFTFDMNKKIPNDLKLFLDKQKDSAKILENSIDGDIIKE